MATYVKDKAIEILGESRSGISENKETWWWNEENQMIIGKKKKQF